MSKDGPRAALLNQGHGGFDLPASVTSGRAVASSMRRVTLSLPLGSYTSLAGPPDLGAAAFIDSTVGGNIFDFNNVAEAMLTPRFLATQQLANLGPITAIAIAADSPLAECDLWIGDITTQARHRIGPGRPWVGDLTEIDHLFVSLPEAFPDPWDDEDNADTIAQWLARNRVWDSQNIAAGAPTPTGRVELAMPLRLEVYRGDPPPIVFQARAPYHVDFTCALNTANDANVTYGQIHWCTQDRRQTEVMISNPDAANAVQVTISGVDPLIAKRVGGQQTQLRRFGMVTVLDTFVLNAGARAKRMYTEPFCKFRVKFSLVGANTTLQAVMHAISRD